MSHPHPLNPYRASASDMFYKDKKLFLIDNRRGFFCSVSSTIWNSYIDVRDLRGIVYM